MDAPKYFRGAFHTGMIFKIVLDDYLGTLLMEEKLHRHVSGILRTMYVFCLLAMSLLYAQLLIPYKLSELSRRSSSETLAQPTYNMLHYARRTAWHAPGHIAASCAHVQQLLLNLFRSSKCDRICITVSSQIGQHYHK